MSAARSSSLTQEHHREAAGEREGEDTSQKESIEGEIISESKREAEDTRVRGRMRER